MQAQLAALRRAPGEALGELVVIERVERAHEDLQRDQRPEDQNGHVPASRNTAVWRISAPKRGWTRSRVKLNQPSASSPWVTVSAPGVSQRGRRTRRPRSS